MQSALRCCSATPQKRSLKNTGDAIMDARVKEVRFCWLYVMSDYTINVLEHHLGSTAPGCVGSWESP